jgi:malonyl-CoA O-methyltransferase
MSEPAPPRPEPRAVRRAFDRATAVYDAADVLGARTREELLSRLTGLPLEPAVVLDVGSGTGHATRALRDRYRRARVIAVDASAAMLRATRRRASWLRSFDVVCADATRLPLPDASVDLVYANLLLPWLADPDGFLLEARRVLKPRGYLTFSSLGPDTLQELRAAWAAADAAPHVYSFTDLHDTGDALVRAGFTAPVMDADRVTVTYGEVAALYRDLRGAGGGNRLATRRRTLTGRARLAAVAAQYDARRDADGRLPATCEIVYGHAWCPDGSRAPRGTPREAVVSLSKLGRR